MRAIASWWSMHAVDSCCFNSIMFYCNHQEGVTTPPFDNVPSTKCLCNVKNAWGQNLFIIFWVQVNPIPTAFKAVFYKRIAWASDRKVALVKSAQKRSFFADLSQQLIRKLILSVQQRNYVFALTPLAPPFCRRLMLSSYWKCSVFPPKLLLYFWAARKFKNGEKW